MQVDGKQPAVILSAGHVSSQGDQGLTATPSSKRHFVPESFIQVHCIQKSSAPVKSASVHTETCQRHSQTLPGGPGQPLALSLEMGNWPGISAESARNRLRSLLEPAPRPVILAAVSVHQSARARQRRKRALARQAAARRHRLTAPLRRPQAPNSAGHLQGRGPGGPAGRLQDGSDGTGAPR